MNLFGACIGSLLNPIFPNIVISILLFVFFIFVAYTLFQKGFQNYAAETIKLKKLEEQKALIVAEAVIQQDV